MLLLGLISADSSLCRAVSEQMKDFGSWQLALFASVDEALNAWSHTLPPLLFWDAERTPITDEMASFFAVRLSQSKPAPLLLVLGTPPEALETFGITERFTRPLRLGYLLTRVQFYQRLLAQAPDKTFPLGPWLFAPRARQLLSQSGGEPLKLTDKETSLLAFLYAACEPVSREELLAAVWGYDARIDTHTLETHIYRLRRKMTEPTALRADPFLVQDGTYQINPVWRTE